MKHSTTLNLVFINVLAASILACSNTPDDNKTCVDENGVAIDDAKCNPGSLGYSPHYRWYYGGGLFNHGSRVRGGGYVPVTGHNYSTTSEHSSTFSGSKSSPSISRGGFGSSGHATSGG